MDQSIKPLQDFGLVPQDTSELLAELQIQVSELKFRVEFLNLEVAKINKKIGRTWKEDEKQDQV